MMSQVISVYDETMLLEKGKEIRTSPIELIFLPLNINIFPGTS